MIPNFTVVYDASLGRRSLASRADAGSDRCVLYPNTLRDLLMELAVRDLYRAKWTAEIHDEWIRNLNKNKPYAKQYSLGQIQSIFIPCR